MNTTVMQHTFPAGQTIQLVQGDITAEEVDAIVNAANSQLTHGAGVAGAIVRRGGPVIQMESSQWVREHGSVTHAQPAYTHAGNLPCKYVIHAVGPMWGEGDEEVKLGAAIHGAIQVAHRLGLTSISFPAISTGIFGFPRDQAARVIISNILDYLQRSPDKSLNLIRLVLYDQGMLQAFINEWEQNDYLRP